MTRSSFFFLLAQTLISIVNYFYYLATMLVSLRNATGVRARRLSFVSMLWSVNAAVYRQKKETNKFCSEARHVLPAIVELGQNSVFLKVARRSIACSCL